jgi:putative hemolysin
VSRGRLHPDHRTGAVIAQARVALPALLRACLRIGAHVCGPPAHDGELGTADLYVLLRMVDVPPRLQRRLAPDA